MKRKKGSAKRENGERSKEEGGKINRRRRQCNALGGTQVGGRGRNGVILKDGGKTKEEREAV